MKTVIGVVTAAAGPAVSALPAEWAAWAEEPGRAVRVEEDGVLLGVVHVVMVGRDEAWYEGLWVKPSERGRGVGRRLIAEADALARGHGAALVRTAVPGHEYGALAVAQRTGFSRHSETRVLVAGVPTGPLDIPYDAPTTLATARDTARITAALEGAPEMAGWHGLVPLGWRFRRLVPELVRGLIKDKRVLVAGGGPDAVALVAMRDQDAVISTLTGQPAQRAALFGDAMGRARASGVRRVVLFVPSGDEATGLRAAFTQHPWCPDGMVMFEKSLAR